ncbi:hypothetical protein D9M70_557440 [compost metagenome]
MLDADEVDPERGARDAGGTAPHGVVENGVASLGVGAQQERHPGDRLLRWVEVGLLLVAAEELNGARVAVGRVVFREADRLAVALGVDRLPLGGAPLVPVGHLRAVGRLLAVEDLGAFVRPQRLLVGVEEAGGISLLPDPFVSVEIEATRHQQ